MKKLILTTLLLLGSPLLAAETPVVAHGNQTNDDFNSKVEQAKIGSTEASSSSIDLPALQELITPLSASHEPFLEKLFPKVPADISPYLSEYPLQEMGVSELNGWAFNASYEVLGQYNLLIKKLQQPVEVGTKDEYIIPKTFLIADLKLAIALNGNRAQLIEAYKAYQTAINNYPNATYALPASYNLALIMLKLKMYTDADLWSERQEARWKDEPEWANRFRQLILEGYYLRGRYIRAEDYLWNLATYITKSELSVHVARRYADSLFWMGRYQEVVDWYNNETIRPLFVKDEVGIADSILYLAESYYQLSRYAEAKNTFERFRKLVPVQGSPGLVEFRIMQCDLALGADLKETMNSLYISMMKLDDGMLKSLATIEWARLTVLAGDTLAQTNAHAIIESFLKKSKDKNLRKEAWLVKAFLNWKLGNPRDALKSLRMVVPKEYVPDNSNAFLSSAGDFAVLLLLQQVPDYWARKDPYAFLVMADGLKTAIQESKYRSKLLYWVGRAYMDAGMVSSGARLFERLLVDIEGPDRARILLELAHAYAALNDPELVEWALSQIKDIPQDPENRELYYTAKAEYYMSVEKYDECIQQFDTLMKSGVRGESLFQFGYQGAVCSAKAKDYEKALKFISLLGLKDDILIDPEVSDKLKKWQIQGLFEKVNVLIQMGNVAEGIALFEKSQVQLPTVRAPLETIFVMIQAYQSEYQPDKAVSLWQSYSDKNTEIPETFKQQYLELLDLLSKAELLQR